MTAVSSLAHRRSGSWRPVLSLPTGVKAVCDIPFTVRPSRLNFSVALQFGFSLTAGPDVSANCFCSGCVLHLLCAGIKAYTRRKVVENQTLQLGLEVNVDASGQSRQTRAD